MSQDELLHLADNQHRARLFDNNPTNAEHSNECNRAEKLNKHKRKCRNTINMGRKQLKEEK